MHSNVAELGRGQDRVWDCDLSDWRVQCRETLTTHDALNAALSDFTDERVENASSGLDSSLGAFGLRVTPHMMHQLRRHMSQGGVSAARAWEAFRRSYSISAAELDPVAEVGGIDGIGEELPDCSSSPQLTNFYGNRILFRVTEMCAAHCRYCFRRRFVGPGPGVWNRRAIDESLDAIRSDRNLREIVFSGGDPLILGDHHLAYLIEAVSEISHIKRIRFDTKILTMLPQRVTHELSRVLSRGPQTFVVGHFSHISEIAPETATAVRRLRDSGIVTLSHTPLLRGISDIAVELVELFRRLVDIGVLPYYLIHFIPTKWTEHFRVPLARAQEIMKTLHQECDGLETPRLIVYLPDGGGKVPVDYNFLLDKQEDGYRFESLDGRVIMYREP